MANQSRPAKSSLLKSQIRSGTVCLSPAEIERRLSDSGVQPTAQRIAIARFVLCDAEHPTAEDVKQWTDKNFPKLSLATVYNTLKTLVQAGLLRELHLPHMDKSIYDNNISHHHHFYDEKTGELFDIEDENCEVKLNLDPSIRIDNIEVFVRGQKK